MGADIIVELDQRGNMAVGVTERSGAVGSGKCVYG